jgi:hypothetical protein
MRTEPPGSGTAETLDPDNPVYEVVFWRRHDEDPAVPVELRSWQAEEWTVHDAEVTEVLNWARQTAGSRPYTVHVAASTDEDRIEKLRLFGQSPVSVPLPDPAPFRLAENQ